jgi:hypothetical protein
MQIAAFGAIRSAFRVESGTENDKCRLDGGEGGILNEVDFGWRLLVVVGMYLAFKELQALAFIPFLAALLEGLKWGSRLDTN